VTNGSLLNEKPQITIMESNDAWFVL